jgi:hypothetical protein
MAWYSDIWRIIDGQRVSAVCGKGGVVVRDGKHFKGLPTRQQERVNAIIENEQRIRTQRLCGQLDSLADVRRRSSMLAPVVINSYKSSTPLTRQVSDAIFNTATNVGMPGNDPALRTASTFNLYLSPQEAASVYSQKGIPEVILNKKSKSILLNGVKIRNKKLKPPQIEALGNAIVKRSFSSKLVEAVLGSLIYGGSLFFPMFKKDTPLSSYMSIEQLIKYGIVGKDCIDRFVVLDRWNTVHIPNWNPTSAEFTNPKQYYIPFLGSYVNGERCARVNTAPQVGYWAQLSTLGWGLSDIPGWIESVYNYYSVMGAIPTMLSQMSVLVRTIDPSSILATEGFGVLQKEDYFTTVSVREASVNNPISLDVIGDIKAIQRDFAEVPALVRLLRQDVGGRSLLPEEVMWSSERGAFASGDSAESAQEKQWEGIKYIHRDVAEQCRNVAMLLVIDTLGTDKEVLEALPYTVLEFDNPIVANAEARASIADSLGKAALSLRGANFPIDIVAQMISSYGDNEFEVEAGFIDILKNLQKTLDERDEEKHDMEMRLKEVQIEEAETRIEHPELAAGGGAPGVQKSKKPNGDDDGERNRGYSKLDQKQHQRSRGTGAKQQGMQKRKNVLEHVKRMAGVVQ